jgi:hypothetical protein
MSRRNKEWSDNFVVDSLHNKMLVKRKGMMQNIKSAILGVVKLMQDRSRQARQARLFGTLMTHLNANDPIT